MTTSWKVEVDWDRDGTYSEITSYVIEAKWFLGFRESYVDTASEGYLHIGLSLGSEQKTRISSSR